MPATTRVAAQFTVAPLLLLPPLSDTGRTGSGVDLLDYEGLAILNVATGAATGSGVLNVQVQSSHDNSTSWTNCTQIGPTGDGKLDNTSGSNQALSYVLDLDTVRRYVRGVVTLVSGTSVILGATINGVKKIR